MRAERGKIEAPQRLSEPKPRATTGEGQFCPTNPNHGRLLAVGAAQFYWYCPHQEHDGRLATHPEGHSPPTKSVWRQDEL